MIYLFCVPSPDLLGQSSDLVPSQVTVTINEKNSVYGHVTLRAKNLQAFNHIRHPQVIN